jgi:glycosyltransferase involved in cell wall biosynthesis
MNQIHSLSIICPVFNGSIFIEDAIMSILNQAWMPESFEIIIVNDGSSDISEAICLKLKKKYNHIKYISLDKNYGVAYARNIGITSSQLQYLAFIDQDDVWPTNKIEIQNQYINDKVNYLVGLQSFELYGINEPPKWFKDKWSDKPQDGHVFGTLLIEKNEFLEVGLLNHSLKLTDDLEWFVRAKAQGKSEFIIPHVLLNRKVHKNNHSANIQNTTKELFNILKSKINTEQSR